MGSNVPRTIGAALESFASAPSWPSPVRRRPRRRSATPITAFPEACFTARAVLTADDMSSSEIPQLPSLLVMVLKAGHAVGRNGGAQGNKFGHSRRV